jgi:hypothetical protein
VKLAALLFVLASFASFASVLASCARNEPPSPAEPAPAVTPTPAPAASPAATATASAEPSAAEDLATEEDFEDESAQAITGDNLDAQLDALEKEIGNE